MGLGRAAGATLVSLWIVSGVLPAAAADLAPVRPASGPEPAWPPFYLRLEAGGAWLTGNEGHWTGPGRSRPRITYEVRDASSGLAGVGFGWQPWRGIRTELSFQRIFDTDLDGTWISADPVDLESHADISSSVSSSLLFGNVFVEPFALAGFDWPVQPFVGFGVGVAFNEMGGWTRTNPAATDLLRRFDGSHETSFAWSVAAGVSASLDRWTAFPLMLDLTYRYVDAGRAEGSRMSFDNGRLPREAFNTDLRYHAVSLGLRMPLGTASSTGSALRAVPVLSRGRNASPYLGLCPEEGVGFFVVPGTETCLRVAGHVRAEYGYFEPLGPGGRELSTSGMRVRGQLALDSRTPTEFGLLRAFVRYEMLQDSGTFAGAFSGAVPTFASLDRAFVQFAGLTAGRVQSFFDFYANELNFTPIAGSDSGASVLAYTGKLGGGYSATVSAENPLDLHVTGGNLVYAGERMPDLVGVLRYDGSEGAVAVAQLSGSVHQVRAANLDVTGAYADTAYGFALQAGVSVRTPFVAAGDLLVLQGTYSEGSVARLGADNVPTMLGGLDLFPSDGVVVGDDVRLTTGYAVTGAFLHYWSPTLRQAVFGSYLSLDYPELATRRLAMVDTHVLQFGTNLVWSPVPGFDIGGEIAYHQLDPHGQILLANGVAQGREDAIEARLRIQRGF